MVLRKNMIWREYIILVEKFNFVVLVRKHDFAVLTGKHDWRKNFVPQFYDFKVLVGKLNSKIFNQILCTF